MPWLALRPGSPGGRILKTVIGHHAVGATGSYS